MWHVSSSVNRESISAHGLDSSRMGRACGIAGATRPEVDGVFLSADGDDNSFFIRMNAPGGLLDVWAVDGVGEHDLVEHPNGFRYVPGAIAPSRVRLVRRDVAAVSSSWPQQADGSR